MSFLFYEYRGNRRLTRAAMLTLLIIGLCIGSMSCAPSPNANNANSRSANTNATGANSNTVPDSTAAKLDITEPERYSAKVNIAVQLSGNAPNAAVPGVEFELAKMGTDKRASFQLPRVGNVVYLEDGGQQYLILPDRKRYAQLDAETLGFELPRLLSPTEVFGRLKSRTDYQTLGAETVNGRLATKYQFDGHLDTRTKAGNVKTESVVYVDESTKLPVRAEIVGLTDNGAEARVTINMSDVTTTPEPALFELPAGFTKVTEAEVRQHLQNLVMAVRLAATVLMQQVPPAGQPAPPQSTGPGSSANTNSSPR